MLGFYGALDIARLNGRASSSGGYCAEAMAAKAGGKKKYTGSGCVFGCDVDKQIEKWCGSKGETAAERCSGAKEALSMGKNSYRMENVHQQIAKWCSADAQVQAAVSGSYSPASPEQVAEELYWDENMMMTAGGGGGGGEIPEEKGSLMLPLAMGGVAILLLGGVLLASR